MKLDDAMKETMRLYPAVLIVVRKAEEGTGGVFTKGPGERSGFPRAPGCGCPRTSSVGWLDTGVGTRRT